MLLSIFLAIAFGIIAGVFTGLTPGIHTNLVAAVLVSLSPALLHYTTPVVLAVFIISISITNSFLDSIPSIFLGAPESDTILGVLPGHRYLLKGWGYMAVKLTLVGSIGAVIMGVLFFPLSIPLVKIIYPLAEPVIGYLLIGVALFGIWQDKKKLWAIFIFFLSGVFGLVVLNMPLLKQPLFPLLSGLFGVSTLLISLNGSTSIPEQKIAEEIKLSPWLTLKALLSGQFSGFLTGILPGMGPAQAAALSMQITRNLGDHGFMILNGSINMFNFIFSISTLYAIDKARNGSIAAISELMDAVTVPDIIIFLAAILISAAASVYLALKIAQLFAALMNRVNYKIIILSVIGLIVSFTILLCGWLGIIVLVVSTSIGLVPAIVKTGRTHGMACLLVPVILYFVM